MCVRVCASACACVCLHACASACVCVCMCVCVCVCVCVCITGLCVCVWKLGTPNYGGLSVIMYLAVELYGHTVLLWKQRTPNIHLGILPARSISMFMTVIFIRSDLNKYLCLGDNIKEN